MAEKKKASVAAPAISDRKKALETAIAKIEKDYGKGTIMRLGDDISINVEALSTGSLSLDLALGIGGLPKGRIIEIYGPRLRQDDACSARRRIGAEGGRRRGIYRR